jgi:hypothetical protein
MVVGRSYDVPCVQVVGDTVFPNEFLRPGELVPVMLPAHEDAEYFDFPHLHYHVDFRFVSDDLWQRMQQCTDHVHACIITLSLIEQQPRLEHLRCMREMPEFPTADEIVAHDADQMYEGLIGAVCGLERHYRDARIDTDTLVCPHRGVCLKGLPTEAGVVVCPAHGLAWNVESGALVERHRSPGPKGPGLQETEHEA